MLALRIRDLPVDPLTIRPGHHQWVAAIGLGRRVFSCDADAKVVAFDRLFRAETRSTMMPRWRADIRSRQTIGLARPAPNSSESKRAEDRTPFQLRAAECRSPVYGSACAARRWAAHSFRLPQNDEKPSGFFQNKSSPEVRASRSNTSAGAFLRSSIRR